MKIRFIFAFTTFLLTLLVSQSLTISLSLGLFILVFLSMAYRKSISKRYLAIQESAPELIDLLISGVQSGLSLNETLVGLADRGPEVLRPYFRKFKSDLFITGDFEKSITQLKIEIGHHSIDQILECLAMAKILGSNELLSILRLLGSFIREDLSLRSEIAVKQNWIKNSAHISAAAPWILLLLLSTQPTTASAYSTRTGAVVLITGLLLTIFAYLWMNFLSKLPEPERIFSGTRYVGNP